MPNRKDKTPEKGLKPLAPVRPAGPKRRIDPRDIGQSVRKGKPRGGRPPLFPGRTGGR